MTAYPVYDVGTDRRFGADQLAVIPDATGRAEGDLLRIARAFNIPENPATGSAATTLAALLAAMRGAFIGTIRQGEDMGRPSTIGVDAMPGRVTVSGRAGRIMQGRLT